MNNLLEIKNICKTYPTFHLENVSLSLPEGYIMGFIGPNGAGKTTTIKSILGIVPPDKGEIHVFGLHNLTNAEKVNSQIGVVMDQPYYMDEWTVRETEWALSSFYPKWDHKQFVDCITKYRLHEKKKIKDLSRGMKVKLMLSVALSHNAKLLILDEPTSGLDPVARDELMETLLEFIETEGRSILFSTHITSDIEKIADYITYIQEGKIVFTGLKDDLMEKYVLVKGGPTDLSEQEKKLVIGYRQYSTGFDGLVLLHNLPKLPKSLVTDSPNLEDIMVYMNKEAKNYG